MVLIPKNSLITRSISSKNANCSLAGGMVAFDQDANSKLTEQWLGRSWNSLQTRAMPSLLLRRVISRIMSCELGGRQRKRSSELPMALSLGCRVRSEQVAECWPFRACVMARFICVALTFI